MTIPSLDFLPGQLPAELERERNENKLPFKGEPRIKTNFWAKPIPLRRFDWEAVTDDYDGAPDAGPQPIGFGATEEEAVADLKEQLED